MSTLSDAQSPWRIAGVLAVTVFLIGLVAWRLTWQMQERISDKDWVRGQFTPESVLGNPDCRQNSGLGPSNDIAVVVLPSPGGSIFAAVDESGVLHTGALPFSSTRFLVARRADGSVLTMFGRNRWDVAEESSQDVRFPVQVHFDDQAVLVHEDAWEFGLANDGSSFFLINPLDEETSELVVNNLEEGGERRYFLGDLFRNYDMVEMARRWSDDEVTYRVRYSTDNAEVILNPLHSGIGTYYFYPTSADGEEPRSIDIQSDDGITGSIFASSEVGYVSFGDRYSTDPSLLVRREYFWPGDGEYQDVWKRSIPITALLQLSASGSHLLMLADRYQVLDTLSGETVLVAPKNFLQATPSPASRNYDQGENDESLNSLDVAMVHGNELVVGRKIASPEPSAESMVYEFYDLDRVQTSEPIRRVSVDANIQCEAGDSPVRGLQERDGRLTFNPRA